MAFPSAGRTSVEADSARAQHYAIVKAATFAALVGAFAFHHPNEQPPASLAQADQAAFEAALAQADLAPGGPAYDVTLVTRNAYAAGQSHRDGDCLFCDDAADRDELVAQALAHAGAVAAAAIA